MNDILHGNIGALWQQFQAPLIGALAAVIATLAGRWMRWPVLLSIAGSLGVCLAWLLLSKSPAAASAAPALKLLPIAVAGAVLCPVAARFLPQRGGLICLVLLAAGGGWWLAGAPRQMAGAMQVGFLLAGLIFALGLGGRLLTRGGMAPLLLAAISLAGALWVARAPPIWLLLALAPGLVALALLAAPAVGELLLLPVALDLLVVALAALLAAGRLPKLGVNAIDVAVIAPFLAVLLAPRLRLPAPIGATLAGGIAIFLAFAARMWLIG